MYVQTHKSKNNQQNRGYSVENGQRSWSEVVCKGGTGEKQKLRKLCYSISIKNIFSKHRIEIIPCILYEHYVIKF